MEAATIEANLTGDPANRGVELMLLGENVRTAVAQTPDAESRVGGVREEMTLGPLKVEGDPVSQTLAMSSEELFAAVEAHNERWGSEDPFLTPPTEDLRKRIAKTRKEILGTHQERLALSAAAFVLAIAGAVAAIRFQEAPPLSAYLAAFLPALAMVLVVSTGQEMVEDYGPIALPMLWGGGRVRLLDRTIASQYFVNVTLLLLILGSFIVVVDASLNLHRYVRYAGEHDDLFSKSLATISVIWSLWWPRLLQLFNFTLGFVLVAGLGFTAAQLVARRELVAVLASGISLWRAMAPVLVVALGFMLVGVANQEFVLPRIVGVLLADDPRVSREDAKIGVTNLPTTADASGRLFFASVFDPDAGEMRGLKVWERDEVGVPLRLISAERAVWDGSAWLLEGGIAQPIGQ
ncbi:Uncharacterized protein SCF082_LOCUS32859, partial [Durusdinium trenchii]